MAIACIIHGRAICLDVFGPSDKTTTRNASHYRPIEIY